MWAGAKKRRSKENTVLRPYVADQQVRIPYSLEICADIPEWIGEPDHPSEELAAKMVRNGQVIMSIWTTLCDQLPSAQLRRQANGTRPGAFIFYSSAYRQGPLCGLRKNVKASPWVCRYIRSCTHERFTSFMLQRNIAMSVHKDLNNSRYSRNILLPCSQFYGGGIWTAAENGDFYSVDGQHVGHMWNLSLAGTTFHPHVWHESCPWFGDRITVAAFSIRNSFNLEDSDRRLLRNLDFNM